MGRRADLDDENSLSLLLLMKPRFLSRPDNSLVTTPTELFHGKDSCSIQAARSSRLISNICFGSRTHGRSFVPGFAVSLDAI
jgi:hypothetical protein